MVNIENNIEDLDLIYYQNGIEEDLRKVGIDWNSRQFPDKLAEGLDKLVEGNKLRSSNKFNRILFSHILDFKSLGKTDSPILVSEFFNSYFQVYESMRRNRDAYGAHCANLANRITEYKNQVQVERQTEKVLENGQTNNSRVKIDIKEVNLYSDISNEDVNAVFNGQKLVFEYINDSEVQSSNQQSTPQDSLGLKEIFLTSEGLNNNYQFAITNINRKISISLTDRNGRKQVDYFTPSECFNFIIEKSIEIPDKGRIDLDIGYIDSNVSFINRLIVNAEQENEESHVHFDNLENSIGLLEEPFKAFMDRHNQDPERQLNQEVNPNKDPTKKNKGGYMSELHRKEIEVSEKVENMILNVSGKKCIVWETIYFLLNKIMLGLVVLILTYRADYATVRLLFILFFSYY